jgi:hypothetical protein
LNVPRVSNFRQNKIHTAEPLLPKASHFDVKIDIEKFKRYKLSGVDQILAKLIQV